MRNMRKRVLRARDFHSTALRSFGAHHLFYYSRSVLLSSTTRGPHVANYTHRTGVIFDLHRVASNSLLCVFTTRRPRVSRVSFHAARLKSDIERQSIGDALSSKTVRV